MLVIAGFLGAEVASRPDIMTIAKKGKSDTASDVMVQVEPGHPD